MPPFFIQVWIPVLFHDELLRVAAGADEIDAAVEAAEVDLVDASMSFHGADDLARDVVNRNLRVLVEAHVEDVNGRVGIEAHAGVVADLLFEADSLIREYVVQLEGEALVVVVVGIFIVALDVGAGAAVSLAGDDEGRADDGGLRIDALRVLEHEVVGQVDRLAPCAATVA